MFSYASSCPLSWRSLLCHLHKALPCPFHWGRLRPQVGTLLCSLWEVFQGPAFVLEPVLLPSLPLQLGGVLFCSSLPLLFTRWIQCMTPISPLDQQPQTQLTMTRILEKNQKKQKHTSIEHGQTFPLSPLPPTMQYNSYFHFIRCLT